MNSRKGKLCVFMGLVGLLIIACEQKTTQETKPVIKETEGVESAQQSDTSPHQMDTAQPKSAKQVVVPDELKNKWPTVSILVKDKSSGDSVSYEVRPNSEFKIPRTSFRLKIGAFLPHFSMNAEQITSLSAELNNPALQVTIYEGGVEKYSGWLFSKFTEMHAFEHEGYSIILEDKFNTPV